MSATADRIAPPTRPWRRIRPSAPGAARIDVPTPPARAHTVAALPARVPAERLLTVPALLTAADLATGRGLTYEWEWFLAQILDRLAVVEDGGSTPTAASYVHTQSTPAATWTITHNLATKPAATIVSPAGDLLFAEVAYPDNTVTVITFGQPYAGTAYLRG